MGCHFLDLSQAEIILASASSRRISILEKAGFRLKAIAANVEEEIALNVKDLRGVGELTLSLSHLKAESIAKSYPNHYVLGADTLVFCDNRLMGKPADLKVALDYLRLLSGQVHQVVTGFTWIHWNKKIRDSQYSVTNVYVKNLNNKEIIEYLNHENVLDAAGAYKIQGFFSRYVTRIEGSYHNVVGLPIDLVYESFCQFYEQE